MKGWKVRAPMARLVPRRLHPSRPRQPSATLPTILPLLNPRSARESMQNTLQLPCMSYSARSRPSSRTRASRLLSPQPIRNKLRVSGYIPRKTSERGNVRGRVEDAREFGARAPRACLPVGRRSARMESCRNLFNSRLKPEMRVGNSGTRGWKDR